MHSFDPGVFERQTLTFELLGAVRLLGEYRGKQDLFRARAPGVLDTLQRVSIVQSTESSNRIEGVETSPRRLQELMSEKTIPRNRSEAEIAGYRDVLHTIHARHVDIPFTPGVVLQLHRDLFHYVPSEGGRWKIGDNAITERRPDGTQFVRFQPVRAHLTGEAMAHLHDGLERRRREGEIDPLLLIPAYILDFLCIHPFDDGNGRMARLLTSLLLYRSGYEVGRYISLEGLVERTRDGYYDTLQVSSQGWHDGTHTLLPWWTYFLGTVLITAYREFEDRIDAVSSPRGAKREMVLDTISRLPSRFQVRDIERVCPVSRPTINRVLADLRKSGKIIPLSRGRDAAWEKA